MRIGDANQALMTYAKLRVRLALRPMCFSALSLRLRLSAPLRLRVRYKPRLIPPWRSLPAATTRSHKSSTHRREKQGSDIRHGHVFKLPGLPHPSGFHQAPIWRMRRERFFKDSTKRKERKGVIRMSDAEVALELLKLAMRTEPAASTNSEKFFELYRKCLAAVRESKA